MKSKWSKRPKHEDSTLNSSTSTLSSISSSSCSTSAASAAATAASSLTMKTKVSESASTATAVATTSTPLSSPSTQNMPQVTREFPFPRLTMFINECMNMSKNKGTGSTAETTTTSAAAASSSSSQHNGVTSTENESLDSSPLLTLDDLDPLQVELETLLCKTNIRCRALQVAQHRFLTNPPYSDDKSNDGPSASTHHRHAKGQRSPPATRRLNAQAISSAITAALQISRGISSPSSSPTKVKGGPGGRRYKKKVRGVTEVRFRWASDRPTRGQSRAHSMKQEAAAIPRQPAHFWDFADSCCRDLTYADLEALEKTIQEHNSTDEDVFDIPPLGKHFRDTENTKTTRRTREKAADRSRDVCGPLTQRLVSALVDNRIHVYQRMKEQDGNGIGDDISAMEGLFISRPGLANSLGIDSGGVSSDKSDTDEVTQSNLSLESRLRKVLVEQGFLSDSSNPDDNDPLSIDLDEKDEILGDILRTQDSLRSLHRTNADKLRQLQALARRELARSQVKLEMEKADKEVMEAYRLISASRSKKKPLTKRERELAARALDHRKQALEKLQKPVPVNILELTDQ